MSYSFTVTCPKNEVRRKVADQLDGIIAGQALHSRDREAALNATLAYVDLVTVPEGRMLKVYVSGSVGWSTPHGDQSDIPLTGAGLSISVQVV